MAAQLVPTLDAEEEGSEVAEVGCCLEVFDTAEHTAFVLEEGAQE